MLGVLEEKACQVFKREMDTDPSREGAGLMSVNCAEIRTIPMSPTETCRGARHYSLAPLLFFFISQALGFETHLHYGKAINYDRRGDEISLDEVERIVI